MELAPQTAPVEGHADASRAPSSAAEVPCHFQRSNHAENNAVPATFSAHNEDMVRLFYVGCCSL